MALCRKKNGNLCGSVPGGEPRHLLENLLQCRCGAFLHVCGKHGAYLGCSKVSAGACDAKTWLRRDLAEQLILDTIGQQYLQNPAWPAAVLVAAEQGWKSLVESQPSEQDRDQRELKDIELALTRWRGRFEAGDEADVATAAARMKELSQRKRKLESSFAACASRVTTNLQQPPSLEWVSAQLQQLSAILRDATPNAAILLRRLVGGRIPVEESTHPLQKRKFLRGHFELEMGRVVEQLLDTTDLSTQQVKVKAEPVSIEFRVPTRTERQATLAWNLYERDVPYSEIATRVGCSKSRLTAVIQYAAKERGVDLVDGRTRRGQTQTKAAALYRDLATAAKHHWDCGLLIHEIAKELGIHPATATKALDHWFEQQGDIRPDGRTRRRELTQRKVRATNCKDVTEPRDAA